MEFYIPFELEEGRFVIAPQEPDEAAPEGSFLRMEITKDRVLEYIHPEYGNRIRVYHVPEDVQIVAAYNSSGRLTQVSYPEGEDALHKPVYYARPNLLSFISVTDIKMPRRILQEKGEVSRLFFDYFYDGDAVDFAVTLGTPEDMAEIRAHYGEDTEAVNNSGDYPQKKRIECSNAEFRILLLCAPPEQREAIFRSTVRQLIDNISKKVLPKLNKAPDFQVIAEEYD